MKYHEQRYLVLNIINEAFKGGIPCYKEQFYVVDKLELSVKELRALIWDLYDYGYITGIEFIRPMCKCNNDDLGYKIIDEFRLTISGIDYLEEYNTGNRVKYISKDIISYIPTIINIIRLIS